MNMRQSRSSAAAWLASTALLGAAFIAVEARGADVQAIQIALLQQQVATLQAEVAALRRVVSVNASGVTLVTASQDRRDITTLNETADVAQDLSVTVGRNRNDSIRGVLNASVGQRYALEAGDEVLFRAGQSMILLRKDGSIVIKGVTIALQGSGEVSIKGAKVLTN